MTFFIRSEAFLNEKTTQIVWAMRRDYKALPHRRIDTLNRVDRAYCLSLLIFKKN